MQMTMLICDRRRVKEYPFGGRTRWPPTSPTGAAMNKLLVYRLLAGMAIVVQVLLLYYFFAMGPDGVASGISLTSLRRWSSS